MESLKVGNELVVETFSWDPSRFLVALWEREEVDCRR